MEEKFGKGAGVPGGPRAACAWRVRMPCSWLRMANGCQGWRAVCSQAAANAQRRPPSLFKRHGEPCASWYVCARCGAARRVPLVRPPLCCCCLRRQRLVTFVSRTRMLPAPQLWLLDTALAQRGGQARGRSSVPHSPPAESDCRRGSYCVGHRADPRFFELLLHRCKAQRGASALNLMISTKGWSCAHICS